MTFEDLKLYTKNPGTYRITAIFDGDDTYNAGTTQFILVVSANPDEPPTIIPLPEGSSEKITPILNFLEDPITQEEDIKTNKYTLQTPNNPSNIALSWSCDDDNVQFDLMNNQVIIPNIGEYLITATFLGDDDYYPVSASYTFRLTDDEGNVVRTQRHYHLYFEEEKYTFYENDDMIFPLQVPKTQRTDDNVVPQEILDLCYYTVNDDDIHLSGENPVAFSELGSYTIYLHFEGNEDWLPQTIHYVFNIIEKENPEISFPQQRVFMHRNDEGKYALQTLYNPHSLSPIRWAVSDTQTDMIRLQPSNNVCYINRYGSFPIFAIFDGNEIYKKQEAAYEIVLIGSQEDANIHFERQSDRYDIEFNIGGGWTTNMPRLINPYNLPVTFSTSTNDIYVSEDGRNITFYRSVRDAVVTATFDGDELWEPMTATYTVTMIAWANRITPTLYFQYKEREVPADEYGRYTLQRVSSPDVPKSELRWRVDGHTDGWRIEALTDDNHILYVDYWDYYTIVVEFDGDENWAPAQATYTLKPQREELTLWFDEPLEIHYGFQEGYISTRPVQTCHSNIGDDIPLHWSTDVPRGCQIDTDSMRVLMYNEGMFTIRADFYGDTRYNPTYETYKIRCTSEEDPTITKEDVTISFENQFVYLQLHEDGTNIYYKLQTPTITPNTIDPSWLSWSCDNGAIAYPYLVAPNGIGTYTITAQYLGSKNYNPSNVATYTVVISDEQVEAQDIEMRFYTPTDRFYVREDNTYDLQYVYWRIAGSNNEWQRCNFELTWTCSDNTSTFDFSDVDYPYITIPSGEGIYTITATFAGNGLYNPAWASYQINVGNVEVERVEPDIRFANNPFNVNENYPDNLYALQAITKPNDIQDSDLVWSISPDAPNEIRGNQIYVWDISEDVVVTVSFAGNDKYLPDAASYIMHVVPETIVKRDVTISFNQISVDWDYNDYYQVETSPLTPILSEEMPLVWEINNGAQMRGNRIYENRVSETILVEVQNPKIYLEEVGTYTVTARFVGDRYRNPASATYDINFAYNYASVYFESDIVPVPLDTSSSHYYYPIQEVTKPNDIEVTYYLYIDENTKYVINQAQGCDMIGSVGDWEIRAYYTEYGVEKYASYTLRVVEEIIPQKINPTLSFASNTISHDIYTSGYDITPQTLYNPDNLIVRYVLPEGITESNGQYVVSNIGTYTITAIFDGNETYNSWTDSYNIVVVNTSPQINYAEEYFTIESLEDDNTIGFRDSGVRFCVKCSTDKLNWTAKTSSHSTNGTTLATLNSGEKLYIKIYDPNYGQQRVEYVYNDFSNGQIRFTSTKTVDLSGNIMSLLYSDTTVGTDDFTQYQNTISISYAFSGIFAWMPVVDASNLILPAITLSTGCYREMFYNCTSLVDAPELPATTLAQRCYQNMFSGCTNLTTAPELPALNLVINCYTQMFYNCSNLNYIKMMATHGDGTEFTDESSLSGYLYYWVYGVQTNSGTFVKNSQSRWRIDYINPQSNVPSNWAIKYEYDI